MGDWGNLRLRQQSIDNITEFLKTEKGKKLGYSSASQLAEYVLRNFIENPDQNQRIEELEKSYQELRKQYIKKRSENSAIKEGIAIEKLIEKSENKKNKELESRITNLETKLSHVDISQVDKKKEKSKKS